MKAKHEQLFLLSKCLKSNKDESVFHFRGVYKGHFIKKVIIRDAQIKKEAICLLKLEAQSINQNILYCKLISWREVLS